MTPEKLSLPLMLAGILACFSTSAQFIDNFESKGIISQHQSPDEWSIGAGDGQVSIEFIQKEDYASIYVDATKDKRNIWWAIIRRQVPGLDIEQLMQPEYELRVEAKIKVSHAPRRLNLHFNHQRTTDFHSHLMEYYIPDNTFWHTISMTTEEFEVKPGDRINVQMALMDWGNEIYQVDIDYLKVDVVNKNEAAPDMGNMLPYHPPLADPEAFRQHLRVSHDAVINREYPELNFNNWQATQGTEPVHVLTVNGTQTVILRWGPENLKGKKVKGSGLLELTTYALQRSPDHEKDFGMVRITEILKGDPDWDQQEVTYNSFLAEYPIRRVLNPQMVIDYPVKAEKKGRSLFTIPEPVLQRMVDGKTLGLAIRPLGAVNASFYSMENENGKYSPVLHLNTE